jgi:hypothetical protein
LLALISGLPIVNTIVMFWLKNIYVIWMLLISSETEYPEKKH